MEQIVHPPVMIEKRWTRSIAKGSQPGKAANTHIVIKSFIKALIVKDSKMSLHVKIF